MRIHQDVVDHLFCNLPPDEALPHMIQVEEFHVCALDLSRGATCPSYG